MKTGSFVCACAVLLVTTCWGRCSAQDLESPSAQAVGQQPAPIAPAAASTAELDAIRAESREFVAAFNAGDAERVAALWTNEGEYIDETGRVFAGREAIAQEYERFFAESKGPQIRIVIDSLKLLSDSAAIEDGRAIVEPPPTGAPSTSRYTAVHVKLDGKWLMSTVRDTRVETPSAYRDIADLEWLIGTWTAEAHGSKTEIVCRWVANKSFVERSYTVTRPDHNTTSGIQVIGWDPVQRRIQSWSFNSDGGHAVGAWSPRENGWAVTTQGVTGDGTSTTAVNLLTRLDDDACTWQSVERTAAGLALVDTDEIVLKRKAADR